MKTVFHAWPYRRFIEKQSNLRRKKLHRTSQGSNFLVGSLSNRDNVRAPIQFRSESQAQHLKACYQIFIFHQIIALQKLRKVFFISSKKLFSFSRYSNFCNFFLSFSHFPDSKGQVEVE